MTLKNLIYVCLIFSATSCGNNKASFSFDVEQGAYKEELPYDYESRVYISNKKGKVVGDQVLKIGEVCKIENFKENELYDLTFHIKITRKDSVIFGDRLFTFFEVKPCKINLTKANLKDDLGYKEIENNLIFTDTSNIKRPHAWLEYSENAEDYNLAYNFHKDNGVIMGFEKVKDKPEFIPPSNMNLNIVNDDPYNLEFNTTTNMYSYFMAGLRADRRTPNAGQFSWTLFIPESIGFKGTLPAVVDYEPAELNPDCLKNLKLRNASLMNIKGEEIIGRMLNEYDPDSRDEISAWLLFDKFEMITKLSPFNEFGKEQ